MILVLKYKKAMEAYLFTENGVNLVHSLDKICAWYSQHSYEVQIRL